MIERYFCKQHDEDFVFDGYTPSLFSKVVCRYSHVDQARKGLCAFPRYLDRPIVLLGTLYQPEP